MYSYDRNMVLAAYRARHPDDLDPKETTLVAFDATLRDAYEREIEAQAEPAGVPLSVFNRSVLALYASMSRAKTPTTRVKHAIRFFNAVRPQSATVVAGTEPTVVPAEPA